MKSKYLIKSIKRNIVYIFILIFIIFILYKYNYSENFTNPACFSELNDCSNNVFDIIVVIGQSNGRGSSVSDIDANITDTYKNDPKYVNDLNYVIDPNIYKVTLPVDRPAKDIKLPSTLNICQAQESKASFSMDVSLAREYVAKTKRKVLIINAAISSTSILTNSNKNSYYVWQKNNVDSNKKALYGPVKDFINLVKSKICRSSKVVAICYRGSEEDAYGNSNKQCDKIFNQTYITNYKNKLSDLFNSYKNDIGTSETKILISGLALNYYSNTRKCFEYFSRNVLKAISLQNGYIFVDTDIVTNNKVKNIKYFQRRLTSNGGNLIKDNSGKLVPKESGVHFDKLSHIELGKRFAYAYFNPNYNS
jgi:hypothetical protein